MWSGMTVALNDCIDCLCLRLALTRGVSLERPLPLCVRQLPIIHHPTRLTAKDDTAIARSKNWLCVVRICLDIPPWSPSLYSLFIGYIFQKGQCRNSAFVSGKWLFFNVECLCALSIVMCGVILLQCYAVPVPVWPMTIRSLFQLLSDNANQ